jgi:hypothetical protein
MLFQIFLSITQSAKFFGVVLLQQSCLLVQTEELEMDALKEIFLKDYKKPDYLCDIVANCVPFPIPYPEWFSISKSFC